MTYGSSDESAATVESLVHLQDALQVAEQGRELLACFDRYGTADHASTTTAFDAFLAGLYGADFVMTDFDGPLFDRGPMHLIFTPGLAALVARAANLMTLRMFTHTLARGHRGTYGGSGYPYFDRAYRSGGLRALIERLEEFCAAARRSQQAHLQDDSELELIRPVPF